jgi:hypothetical protein
MLVKVIEDKSESYFDVRVYEKRGVRTWVIVEI